VAYHFAIHCAPIFDDVAVAVYAVRKSNTFKAVRRHHQEWRLNCRCLLQVITTCGHMTLAWTHYFHSGNRVGLHQLLSSNISVIRPSIHLALAVCLAGHIIHSEQEQEQCKDSFQFTACALILLRDTGGGGADVGTACTTAAELRKACLKEDFCDWSRPSTIEWAPVLQSIELSFAHKEHIAANIGIIELAMVVGASRFIHAILAPPPPAASFINFTVESRTIFVCCSCCCLLILFEVRAHRHNQEPS
jgi:hypothetical protein